MVLFVFTIMLLNAGAETRKSTSMFAKLLGVPALIAFLGIISFLIQALLPRTEPVKFGAFTGGTAQAIGKKLFTGVGVLVALLLANGLYSYVNNSSSGERFDVALERADKVYMAAKLKRLGIEVISEKGGNIDALKMVAREGARDFFDLDITVEVHDVKHLNEIMASLRSRNAVSSVARTTG